MATRRAEPGLGRDVAVIAGIRDRDARKGRRFATWRRKKGRWGTMSDPAEHASHYTCFGAHKVIDITERLSFCRGSAIKYLARAGRKDGADELEDLRKAAWYVQREIQRIEGERPLERIQWNREEQE